MTELVKLMHICPCVMFIAQIFREEFLATKTNIITSWRGSNASNNFGNFFCCIFWTNFSGFPFVCMMIFHMFRLIFYKFKVFYSIVCFYSINMMYSLIFSKLSTKILLHNIAMIKNAFTIYINTNISKRSNRWFPFSKVFPIGRDVIILVSKPSASMYLTNLTVLFFKNIRASINSAYFVCNHKINHIMKGRVCQ